MFLHALHFSFSYLFFSIIIIIFSCVVCLCLSVGRFLCVFDLLSTSYPFCFPCPWSLLLHTTGLCLALCDVLYCWLVFLCFFVCCLPSPVASVCGFCDALCSWGMCVFYLLIVYVIDVEVSVCMLISLCRLMSVCIHLLVYLSCYFPLCFLYGYLSSIAVLVGSFSVFQFHLLFCSSVCVYFLSYPFCLQVSIHGLLSEHQRQYLFC